jgi:hypothetical protein
LLEVGARRRIDNTMVRVRPAVPRRHFPEGDPVRKIIVNLSLTLDGVMQPPGRPDEDPRGGFQYGGWVTS